MRICLLSNYQGALDEGMGNIAFHLGKELAKYHQVIHLNNLKLFTTSFWKGVKDFQPEIIHYIPGPSIKSFIILRALVAYCPKAKAVLSATRPTFSLALKGSIPLFKPDLVLAQSYETERLFANLGLNVMFLPNGVNINKFIPVSQEVKLKLREKYQIAKEKFIVLHVGPVKIKRGIEVFVKIQQEHNTQVIIIGSITNIMERNIYDSLKRAGCLVWRRYLENIEEVYALSDCYVFPTTDRLNSVEMPLSVMEAMSCNLPVITTRFGALPRIFDEGDGLYFAHNQEEFLTLLNKIKSGDIHIKTREKVLPFTWEKVAKRLDDVYNRWR